MKPNVCPVCDGVLVQQGPAIDVAHIFARWSESHAFSREVIQEHIKQSPYTVLHQCPNCLLEIYLPSVIGTEKFYQELQEDAPVSYYRYDKWDFDEALKEIAGCESIIEIGCGPGSFLERAKPRLKRAYGTEFNGQALQMARSKGLEVFGLETDMKRWEASFDAVFSFHVLEHVADPVAFIKEISALAKPGGKICISVPNQAGPIRHIPDPLMNMPPHHATRWQLKTFRTLADKLNFQILRVAYEPLLLENHNYYSHFWINSKFSARTRTHKAARMILSPILDRFFSLLIRLEFKYFSLLRGQAIYVVMRSKEA
jgi:2-polyprenyl-3-methyl-5-hydroxy-6-metoxy-1,4-benzoquinol methylase